MPAEADLLVAVSKNSDQQYIGGLDLPRIACLAGGVGAARFLTGLQEVVPPESLTCIVNTGDDEEFHGLHVSPDLDIVCYTLGGIVDEKKGWGIKDDTFNALEILEEYRNPAWFKIGDRDFATHIFRTQLLKQGHTLTEVTQLIAARLGIQSKILPMSNNRVRTRVRVKKGWLPFQEYFVKERFKPKVQAIDFQGIKTAKPTPQVESALMKADGIIICPSNPIVSIGPILSLKGIRSSLKSKRSNVVAISPIVEGRTLKGPADEMMKSLGHESSAYGVAQLYRDIAGAIIIDEQDERLRPRIERLGMDCMVTNTIMVTRKTKIRLAEEALRSLQFRSRLRAS